MPMTAVALLGGVRVLELASGSELRFVAAPREKAEDVKDLDEVVQDTQAVLADNSVAGMLARIMVQQLTHVAADYGCGHDHLGVKQRVRGVKPMQEPAMTVGPLHHGGDTEAVRRCIQARRSGCDLVGQVAEQIGISASEHSAKWRRVDLRRTQVKHEKG